MPTVFLYDLGTNSNEHLALILAKVALPPAKNNFLNLLQSEPLQITHPKGIDEQAEKLQNNTNNKENLSSS